MHDKKILVSVILPVYNGQNYVREAIETVLAQDYPNVELVLVNDGSTDDTAAILQAYADRAFLITQANKGLGAARNAGVNAATGTYLSFIDHDDCWEPHKLSCQLSALILSDQDPLVFSYVKQFICPTLNEQESAMLRVPEAPMPGVIAGTLLLSRSRFKEVGDFFEMNQVGEFIDWYLRAQEKKLPVHIVPNVLLHRRIHKTNMGRQSETHQRQGYLKILKASLIRRRVIAEGQTHE